MTDKVAASTSTYGVMVGHCSARVTVERERQRQCQKRVEESPYLSDSTFILSAIPCYWIKL